MPVGVEMVPDVWRLAYPALTLSVRVSVQRGGAEVGSAVAKSVTSPCVRIASVKMNGPAASIVHGENVIRHEAGLPFC